MGDGHANRRIAPKVTRLHRTARPPRRRLRWRAGLRSAILTRSAKAAAKVAELVDALDLGSGGAARGGSSPPFRTIACNTSKDSTRHANQSGNPRPARAPAERRRARSPTIESRGREAPRAAREDRQDAGFRPGKVPIKMVAQQYGPQVRSDVISDTVQASFADAVREQNLRVAGYPRIEPKADADGADQLEFSAIFEVYPEIKLGDLADGHDRAPASPRSAPPTSTSTIEVLRKQRARYEPVDARGAGRRPRDRRLHRARSTASSSRAGRRRTSPIMLGEGRMLPEFEAARHRHARPARRKTFRADVPGRLSRQGSRREGRASSTLTVKSVERAARCPTVDAEFAQGVRHGERQRRRAATPRSRPTCGSS